jgi:hypothetical protein
MVAQYTIGLKKKVTDVTGNGFPLYERIDEVIVAVSVGSALSFPMSWDSAAPESWKPATRYPVIFRRPGLLGETLQAFRDGLVVSYLVSIL